MNVFYKYIRIIHRDLGFLVFGVCIVYGISGFFLNHMNGKDPSYKTEQNTVQLISNADINEVLSRWKCNTNFPQINKIAQIDNEHYRLMLKGGIGIYTISTGVVEYECYSKRPFIYWVNKLHYNQVKGWNIIGDCFAGSLLLLAISGLFRVTRYLVGEVK